jgi:hypothetical protein
MRDVPVFIPFGDDHLAATLTIPDDQPRGMALLMTGLGAPRSHRFQMWTTAARRLASEHGIGSIRADWVGMGDSTGVVEQWGWRAGWEVSGQMATVARFGLRALGVDQFVATGNCVGGGVAVAMGTTHENCIGAVSLLTHLMLPNNDQRTGAYARLRKTKLAGIAANSRVLRKHVIRPIRNQVTSTPPEFVRDLRAALTHAQILFIYGDADPSYNPKIKADLDRVWASVPPEDRSRLRLEVLEGEHLGGFESVRQRAWTIETVLDWTERCFQWAEGRSDRAPSSVAGAEGTR